MQSLYSRYLHCRGVGNAATAGYRHGRLTWSLRLERVTGMATAGRSHCHCATDPADGRSDERMTVDQIPSLLMK